MLNLIVSVYRGGPLDIHVHVKHKKLPLIAILT